jgi:hypothetical protein
MASVDSTRCDARNQGNVDLPNFPPTIAGWFGEKRLVAVRFPVDCDLVDVAAGRVVGFLVGEWFAAGFGDRQQTACGSLYRYIVGCHFFCRF